MDEIFVVFYHGKKYLLINKEIETFLFMKKEIIIPILSLYF